VSSVARAALLASLTALVSLVSLAGCAARPTHVERGERYHPGSPRFDAFFADVHASHRDGAAAAERRRHGRARLARSLGLQADASEASLTRSVRERSERLARKGVHLQISESGATAQGGDGSGAQLAQSLSACVRTESETVDWSARARHRAEELRSRGHNLENHVDDLPRSRRSEGRRELQAADHDLRRQSERARSMGADSEHFLGSLRQAAHPTRHAPHAHGKGHGKQHPGPNQGPAPARPPPADAPPTSPDDFDP
jgi:hypothetical protein